MNTNQKYFDMLTQDTATDVRRMGKWMVPVVAFELFVMVWMVILDILMGMVIFGLAAVAMVGIFFLQRSRARKLENWANSELKFLKVYGTEEPKQELIQKLNEEYEAGRLLYCRNEKRMRAFVFPRYLVYTFMQTITVVAESKLYWGYLTVHRTNGIVTGRTISFFTDEKEVSMSVPKEEFGHELLEQLAEHYSMWIGYDDDLARLYSKDRAEFIRKMDDYKWYKKVPV